MKTKTKRITLGVLAGLAVASSVAALVLAEQDQSRWETVTAIADSVGDPDGALNYLETRAIAPNGTLMLTRTWSNVEGSDPARPMRDKANKADGWTLSSNGGSAEGNACTSTPSMFCSWVADDADETIQLETPTETDPLTVTLITSENPSRESRKEEADTSDE